MIWYDVTKAAGTGHRSGLARVNVRLREELGEAVREVEWASWVGRAGPARRVEPAARAGPPYLQADDWFFTTELFSEAERPGLTEFLRRRPCRSAAVFYDAIPLKHPAITWPQSVARHPGYLKLLASFDLIWAISAASREELLGFWRWAGISRPPPVEVLPLGADFSRGPRTPPPSLAERGSRVGRDGPSRRVEPASPGVAWRRRAGRAGPPYHGPALLCVGILEPRKNQSFLLDVCEELWTEGVAFELHLAGRCNPQFGRPLLRRIEDLARRQPGLRYHGAAGDAAMAQLYARARAGVFPTLAEGCGLPLLESLWMGIPCVCSDLPVLRENSDGGGCIAVRLNDRPAWKSALRRILTDDACHQGLAEEAARRPLPTWAEAAQKVLSLLR